MRFFADMNFIAQPYFYMGLTITSYKWHRTAVSADNNFNLAIAGDHHGPTAERVRVHRHQSDSIKFGVHNRATATERISGGAGRGGDNHAVRTLTGYKKTIHIQLKFQHMNKLPGMQRSEERRV